MDIKTTVTDLIKINKVLVVEIHELQFHMAINIHRERLSIEDILRLIARFVFVMLLFIALFQHINRVVNYYLPSDQYKLAATTTIYLN